ncbi:trypsin-like peptidase domain-containing protein [Virgibacillus sp. LDC-1]|uniref:S1C family serine protease n=1 Tax=Virgibacillus sp. LDC-1 TaxID=3039856 RepID=UPI0024DE3062|nr:trypsin-like peptidase domain-containing protein [Virgibacillus sp. LDC-1]
MDQNEQQPTEQNAITEEHTEHPPVNEDENKKEPAPASETYTPTNKIRGGKSGLIGGIVGGISSAIIVAMLFSFQIIPIGADGNKDSGNGATSSDSPEIVKTMASDGAETAANIEEASHAVVGVINLQQQDIWTPSEEAGSGSGIIYKKKDGKAYIVTNHHVVEGAQEVEIVLHNDERIKAKVLGSDKLSDLAVLQTDGEKIDTVASLGSTKDVKVGDTVLAIGNPLGLEFANSLTKGIVSGMNRSVSIDTNGDRQPDWITEVIQTDAAINPGNSGGALVDGNGNVIGINSMKIARQEVEGIGFAIPVDAALPIMEQLESDGKVIRPFIGIGTAPLNQVPPQYRQNVQVPENVEGGMVIANVEPGSPADEAGLQQFDVITKINGENVTTILELRKYLYAETTVGDLINIEIYRGGKKEIIKLKLTDRNSNV